jgi:hypothetical protein
MLPPGHTGNALPLKRDEAMALVEALARLEHLCTRYQQAIHELRRLLDEVEPPR